MKTQEDSLLSPLARSIRKSARRSSPLALFELATSKWLRGERLEIVQLASELGVSRATLFRWVGTREQLYGEVISGAYARQRAAILRATPGRGIARYARVVERSLQALFESAPLRTFIAQDPEFAIRVLTSKSSPVQARSMELEVEFLQATIEQAQIKPIVDLDTLAFLIVRIGEAFLYADVISGRTPEIKKVVAAICLLVAGQRKNTRLSATKKTKARARAR